MDTLVYGVGTKIMDLVRNDVKKVSYSWGSFVQEIA